MKKDIKPQGLVGNAVDRFLCKSTHLFASQEVDERARKKDVQFVR